MTLRSPGTRSPGISIARMGTEVPKSRCPEKRMLASPYTTMRSSRPPAAAVRNTISGPTPEASPIVMAIGGAALTVALR